MNSKPAMESLYDLAEAKFIPLNMMLELTYLCNEKCLHCYLPETRMKKPTRLSSELTTAEWSGVLEQLAEAGTMYLTLTGGEVLLRKDFPEILCRARELYFAVEIFTNATLVTPQIADYWAEMNVQGVGISCYSPHALWHDRVTRLKGSFEASMRGARLLKDRGIAVKLKTPMMKLNHSNYEALIALAAEMGVGFQFDPMLVAGNDGSQAPLRLGLKDEQLETVYKDARLAPLEEVLLAGPLAPDAPTCSAGRTSGAIGPYGDVVPCIQWMVRAGNVREKPLAEIWKDADILLKARSFTGKDVKPCPDCGPTHFIHCLGTSQLERKDPLIASSEACRLTRTMKKIQSAAQEKI